MALAAETHDVVVVVELLTLGPDLDGVLGALVVGVVLLRVGVVRERAKGDGGGGAGQVRGGVELRLGARLGRLDLGVRFPA